TRCTVLLAAVLRLRQRSTRVSNAGLGVTGASTATPAIPGSATGAVVSTGAPALASTGAPGSPLRPLESPGESSREGSGRTAAQAGRIVPTSSPPMTVAITSACAR